MNMPKSRDIQAKMPSPKVILNAFWHVTVKVLNSYLLFLYSKACLKKAFIPPDLSLLYKKYFFAYFNPIITFTEVTAHERERKPETD